MLGTGSALVTHCFNTCFVVKLSGGEYFLTDAGGGNGILRQFELAKIDWTKLRYMFVTHGHTDHVLGVIWVIRKIATMLNQGKYTGKFLVYCHDTVKNMLQIMTELTLKKKDLAQVGQGILINEVKDGDKVEFADVNLTAFDICSPKAKQFGYELRFADGTRLCCLGDEPYNEHDKAYAQGADWLLAEAFCKYEDRDVFKPYEKNHSTCKEAGEIAAALKVKNLVLYHTEDKTLSCRKAEYTAEAAKYYGGNNFVPDDLEVIELK